MSRRPLAVIILAAGMGTRMKSDLHKVLHPVAGRPMLMHLLGSVSALSPERTIVVVGARREQVERALAGAAATVVKQEPQHGTGHAVLQAREALAGFEGDVLILNGDVPLVRGETMAALVEALDTPVSGRKPTASLLTFRPADPLAYGRVVVDGDGVVTRMVEFKDATAKERAIPLCNAGIYAVRGDRLFALLDQVTNDNAQREYYLPDIVAIAARGGEPTVAVEVDPLEAMGIDSRAALAATELAWQQRRRAELMAAGVTLVDPASVWLSYDTVIAPDVLVEPNVVFGPGVTIASGARIRGFSHIEGAAIGEGCEIGPFARLRPGTELGHGVKIGNFVETKKAVFAAGAKANHLAYIGDASVGAKANIGAGTITCNYDGFFKYKTEIGAGAFIGSNSALVAPVKIGVGAIVGAGAVVTRDVAEDALALVRPEQTEKPGWAKRFRDAMTAKKAAK